MDHILHCHRPVLLPIAPSLQHLQAKQLMKTKPLSIAIHLDAAWVSHPGEGNIDLAVAEEVLPHVDAGCVKCLPLGLQWC